jgi:protein gp37
MAMWSPWRGCHKYSDGCKHCYIHKGDYKRGIDTNIITKNENFYAPIVRNKNGEYRIKAGQLVYLCFQTDFLIAEADVWRDECWKMIKERTDLKFLFLTKRIERFMKCIPNDWGDGYDNVIVCCTIENQEAADYRLNIFSKLPIRHKNIICQPLLEEVNIDKYLNDVELVVVGGESDINARLLNYDWILKIRQQCVENKVDFEFRQCGTHFIKDDKSYTLQTKDLCRLARKANIDYKTN